MNYGDFSSLVQLGVGLHLGAALLQTYGELGLEPFVRSIGRTRSLFMLPEDERPPKALEDELDRLESRYEIFKIQFFHEYRRYVFIDFAVGFILAIVLTVIAFKAQKPIPESAAILIVAFSLLPAPILLASLWFDASRRVNPMKREADALERRALAAR
jgi:hypothetical protein